MIMESRDLELAKLKLTEENLSLVIVKTGEVIFETRKQGISGFLQAIDRQKKSLVGASAADKIVGIAAATLCAYSGLVSIFALTISEAGIRILEDNNIACVFQRTVTNILNRSKTDVCPFEKLAMTSGSPDDAYVKLKSLTDQMMKESSGATNC